MIVQVHKKIGDISHSYRYVVTELSSDLVWGASMDYPNIVERKRLSDVTKDVLIRNYEIILELELETIQDFDGKCKELIPEEFI